jgi:hypothetical protein
VTAAVNIAVIVALIAVVFGYVAFEGLPRRRWEKPLREKMRAQPVTFTSGVAVKADQMQADSGPLNLTVYGDTFQVAPAIPIFGLLSGTDFCYHAPATTVEMVHGVLRDWIEICGYPGTGAVPIKIGRRKANRQLWDVLVSAGAHPIGPPPAQ